MRTWKSKWFFFTDLIKYLYKAGLTIDTGYNIVQNSVGIYIDHVGYINGLYYKIFSINKKKIYTQAYPRGLYCIDYSKKNIGLDIKDSVRIFPNKKFVPNANKKKINVYLKKVLRNPNKFITWMNGCNYEEIKKINKIKEAEYIIYAHSFCDGQLWYGNDGFANLYKWLDFTIGFLSKKNSKTIIKAHPSFFNKLQGKVGLHDIRVFSELKKKYSFNKNFTFIDFSVKNSELLKIIPKKAVLISHHGSALIEGTYLNFKTICSTSTIWNEKLKISNQWSNIQEYKNLLKKNWGQLKYANNNDFLRLADELYFNPYLPFRKNCYRRIIQKHLTKSYTDDEIRNKGHSIYNIAKRDKKIKKIIREISVKGIDLIN